MIGKDILEHVSRIVGENTTFLGEVSKKVSENIAKGNSLFEGVSPEDTEGYQLISKSKYLLIYNDSKVVYYFELEDRAASQAKSHMGEDKRIEAYIFYINYEYQSATLVHDYTQSAEGVYLDTGINASFSSELQSIFDDYGIPTEIAKSMVKAWLKDK